MHEMNTYANAMHEMTWYEMHENENNTRRQDPNPRNKYNLAPETARVGYKYGKYIWGVTTLHHYEKISSRDLGLKELRVLRTEVILAFPGSFTVGMV